MNSIREFIDISIDATIVVNESGIICEVNKQVTKLLGYSRQDLLGQSVEIMMSEGLRDKHIASRNAYMKNPSLREMGEFVDLEARHKSGKIVYVSIGLSPFITEVGEKLILVAIRDNAKLHFARVQMEDKLAELRNITETAIDGIITINAQSEILSWNAAASALFGYSQDEALGQSVSIIIPKAMRKGHLNGVSKLSQGGASKLVGTTVEVEGLRKSGQTFPLSLSISSWVSGDGHVFCGILRDITEQKNANRKIIEQRDQLERIAISDPLTAAFNRRHYETLSEQEFCRHKRYQHVYSILMLDIDHFKNINDNYGHDMGDLAIKQTAILLKEYIRQTDYLFRIGGEEFLILLPETHIDTAITLAERLRNGVVHLTIDNSETAISFTVSIGASEYTSADHTMADTLKRADNALYRAKSLGRNRVETQ